MPLHHHAGATTPSVGDRSSRARVDAIDLVRGVIMIIMALDHTRDFFGVPGQSPTNLATASAQLFLTRWVTHFCAPVFFLLAGTGAFVSLRRKTVGELSRFLFSRGLWLIFLELGLVRCFAYQFNVDYQATMLLVLWALGWAMIVLSGLVRLPASIVAGFGVLLIASHNLFDAVRSANPLWAILHAQQFALNTAGHSVFVAYPLIPWIGVTAAGYGLGQIYAWSRERRRAFLLRLGLALCAAFLVLRGVDVYGDPSRWMTQKTAVFTALSFLNTTKQPPSLLYLLMTLGPAMLFLWAAEGSRRRFLQPAALIGRVPLFYYVLHFVLIHLLAVATCYLRYGSAHWMFESPDVAHYPFTPPPGWGFSLPIVYLLWAAVVVAMYPLCRWFATLKQRRKETWLSYL